MSEEEMREKVRESLLREAEQLLAQAVRNGFVLTMETGLTPKGEMSRFFNISVRHARGFYPKDK